MKFIVYFIIAILLIFSFIFSIHQYEFERKNTEEDYSRLAKFFQSENTVNFIALHEEYLKTADKNTLLQLKNIVDELKSIINF